MPTQKDYKAYSLASFRKIPQMALLSEEERFNIEVVGHVLPFKVNNYITDELIDWDNYETDPLFQLTFPQKAMLQEEHFEQVADLIKRGNRKQEITGVIDEIRETLNPHPAGQLELNVPQIDGMRLPGVQHKYRETALFFPSKGQTCHAYCTFCFRWPQFVGMDDLKFAMSETSLVIRYLQDHPEVTDLIFTGGDPMIMAPEIFASYLNEILDADLPNLQNIRIGSKSLSFWPYKFTEDEGADKLLKTFRRVKAMGKHLSFMAHFNHPQELQTQAVRDAIDRILGTGCQVRTQAPLMQGINDNPSDWSAMWKEQVRLGCIPYYMFVARDTGAQDYFAVSLDRAWRIFKDAYKEVSGICRTVRGPSMSAAPGKVQVVGVQEVHGQKVFVLNFLQARNPDWVGVPFFARYDPDAIWLDELVPAFGEESFFFEEEMTADAVDFEMAFE